MDQMFVALAKCVVRPEPRFENKEWEDFSAGRNYFPSFIKSCDQINEWSEHRDYHTSFVWRMSVNGVKGNFQNLAFSKWSLFSPITVRREKTIYQRNHTHIFERTYPPTHVHTLAPS